MSNEDQIIANQRSTNNERRETGDERRLIMQNKPNFQNSQMNVSIFSQKVYESFCNWTLGENKPNQTQFYPAEALAKADKPNLVLRQFRPDSYDFSQVCGKVSVLTFGCFGAIFGSAYESEYQ